MKFRYTLLLLSLLIIPLVLHINKRSNAEKLSNKRDSFNSYIESSIVKVQNAPSYSSALLIVDSTTKVIDSISQTIEAEVFNGAMNQIHEFTEIKSAVELGVKSESDPLYSALFFLNYHSDNGKTLKFLLDTVRANSLHHFDSLILETANRYLEKYSNDTLGQLYLNNLLRLTFLYDKVGDTAKISAAKSHNSDLRDYLIERRLKLKSLIHTIKYPPKDQPTLEPHKSEREPDTTSFDYYLKTNQIKKAEELIKKTHILNVPSRDLSRIVRYFCKNGNKLKAQYYFNLLNNRLYRYGDYEHRGMCHIFFASYYFKQGNTVRAQKHLDQGLSYKKYTNSRKYKRFENWQMYERIKKEAAIALTNAGRFNQAIAMAAKVRDKEGYDHHFQIWLLINYAKTNSANSLIQFIETSLTDSIINRGLRKYLDLTYIKLTEFYSESDRKDDAQILFNKAIEHIASTSGKGPKIRRLIEVGILSHKYNLEITDKSQEALRNLIKYYCPVGEINEIVKRDL